MLMRLVLGLAWCGMVESCQCALYVLGHGEVYFAVLVVPDHGDSWVLLTFPVLFYFVVFFESLDEDV